MPDIRVELSDVHAKIINIRDVTVSFQAGQVGIAEACARRGTALPLRRLNPLAATPLLPQTSVMTAFLSRFLL